MENMRKMLQDMVGIEGLESLNKAIYRSGTQSVADPLELYLPLMVVPRTILSWLTQNILPLKPGQYKDLPFPGRPDIIMHIEKQGTDTYRGEFVQEGKVIHTFDKQTLPSLGGHFMTVGEQYDHLNDGTAEKAQSHNTSSETSAKTSETKLDETLEANDNPKERSAEKPAELELPKAIMSLNGVAPSHSEDAKWAYSHMNVKELVGVIGKLVDALVANHKTKSDLADAIGKEEMKGDAPKAPIQEIKEGQNTTQLLRPEQDRGPTVPEKTGTETPRVTPHQYFRMSRREKMARAHQANHEAKHGKPDPKAAMAAAIAAIENKKNPPAKKMDTLAATESRSVGGKAVSKAGELPGGAAMAKKPQAAQMPMPPVPQSNNPAAAASKQSQASARGKQAKPPTAPKAPAATTAKMPTNPSKMTTKSDEHCGGNYFSNKLQKIRGGKAEYGMGTGGGYPGGAIANTEKSEHTYHVTEEEIYTPCKFCGIAEFEKSEQGPKFRPCMCFMVMAKNEEGKDVWFVRLSKSTGGYKITFNPQADSDSTEAFMKTLKAKLARTSE